MAHEYPTDETVALPWRRESTPPPPAVLHLVIAWFLEGAHRVGEAARLDLPSWLGRGERESAERVSVTFRQIRPGSAVETPALESTAISRRQLRFDPEGATAVRVSCVGKRTLFHNGMAASECVARAGDTLMLENTAVFLLEDRVPVAAPLRHFPASTFPFGAADSHGIVGETSAAWRLRDELAAAAETNDHVLLLGESGSGKELAAGVVHGLSEGRAGPFVARNAATFPAGLVDAELFGTARNYPNAGSPERIGLVASADGGTLFLDEIGELPQEQQAHLLRVLDRGGEYQRLGDAQTRRSRFRLVAATNRNISSLKHDFLARFTRRIRVPGLDERVADIPFLIRETLARQAATAPAATGRFLHDGVPRIDPVLVDLLLRRRYTHHVRELQRLLGVSLATSADEYLAATPEVLAELRDADADSEQEESISVRTAADIPPDHVVAALRETGGNVTRAAARLGITRYALRRLMRKHGVAE